MGTVTITFDVDGTLAFDIKRICELIRRDHGVEFHPEHVTEWNQSVPGIEAPISELMGEYRGTGEFLPEMEPIVPSCNLLRELSARSDVSIQIATHRPESAADATRAWLDCHDLSYDKFYCGSDIDKGAIAGDCLIDDKIENVVGAAEQGVTSVLVLRHSNTDYPRGIKRLFSAAEHRKVSPESLVHNEEEQWAAIREIVEEHVLQ